MVVYEKKRFPSIMDNMGKEMHYLSLILNLSKWASKERGGGGGCGFNSGCPHQVNDSSLIARHAHRLPDKELPIGYPLVSICKRHCIFMEGSLEKARNLYTLLDIFADFSGLQRNRVKSAFVGFGLTQEESPQCSEALRTLIGSLPMRYLGLPLKKSKDVKDR